jgi:predicted RNA-binding protein with PUA-like domain
VKSDPDAYSYDDLVRDGTTTWDGVANPVALKHMRGMKKGDDVFVYATGKEKSVIGLAKVASDAQGEPPTVELAAGPRLKKPVTLAAVKADPSFAGWELVRVPRLSVMPVSDAQWKRIVEMGGG